MSDDDKETAISEKTSEVRETKFSELSASSKKNEELAGNYKTRAEKAEKGEGKKPKVNADEKHELSQKDVIFLAKTDVHEDDFDDVVATAKEKGISVKEAHDYMKPILDSRADKRKTAEATNTKAARRGNKKVSEGKQTRY